MPSPSRTSSPTGSTAHVSQDVGILILGDHHFGRVTIPVPYAPPLVGLRFYHQALVLDTAANATGLVISDATVAVVGE